ncbi:Plant intracellular Ras-group-related LRR protein 4 [Ananas comosus]|uniref:Plant intracellular Ras-group-related LRR protein 4 n=1 Tax=Ananas comosus TaxID=4615 RepID=A0A199V780_ANACO|nr:Plant intracellular Ras-group-related LRR protein 4 [Ananas comosus]
MGPLLRSVDAVVEEIMRLHRSLPPRPTIEEIEAAASLVRHVDEEAARVESLSRQSKGPGIPDELFFVLLEMQKNLVYFNSREQKREALKLLDLENIHVLFDEMIQRASNCLPSSSSNVAVTAAAAGVKSDVGSSSTVSPVFHTEKEVARSSDRVARDDSYVKKAKSVMCADGIASESHASHGISSMNSTIRTDATSGEDREKLSLIKLASLIEVSAKKGTRDLNLQNKLMDQIDWLPDSLGKLSNLISLDLSENRIVVLPTTIGSLSSLTKLDLHSNRIVQLPDTIGDLHNLLYLDLRGNQLSLLPSTFGKLVQLEEVDLSSNQLLSLPDSIGNLIRLKKLNIETNDIEELPHTIGHCASLVELRADYNRLKALPEAIGKLESLEILSVRYNNIKGLPTTMASLPKLKEIDVSFNELESVPESLCLVTTLVKLNLGNNFADLQSLPRSIGNLEMLEELDISNNQIRVLPDSFRMLLRLRILRAEENPLEVPPRHIAEMGAQAVVQYMTELVAKRDTKLQPIKSKKSWAQFCFFSRPNKRKHDRLDNIT